MIEKKIIIKKLLAENKEEGMTITEICKTSKLPRSIIRDILAELRGAKEVEYKKKGMCKIYKIKT